ncbi:hypothetical protein OQA88_12219 [Cercophora sp. LCS_1]
MNKNWNDRADKDLFFTILSVKQIGVISGSEWTTIGNHMRSMGYGFTNEGCRQHFQGLRRAQNKAEPNGLAVGGGGESSRKVDPTLNPITRRPGPGRGRPRKKPADAATAAAVATAAVAAGASVPPAPMNPGPNMTAGPGGLPMVPDPSAASMIQGIPQAQMHPVHPVAQMMPSGHDHPHSHSHDHGQPQLHPALQGDDSSAQDTPGADEELAVDPSLEDDPEDEHVSKRQRLDVPQDTSMEDEAVLNALAAHANPDSAESYEEE